EGRMVVGDAVGAWVVEAVVGTVVATVVETMVVAVGDGMVSETVTVGTAVVVVGNGVAGPAVVAAGVVGGREGIVVTMGVQVVIEVVLWVDGRITVTVWWGVGVWSPPVYELYPDAVVDVVVARTVVIVVVGPV